MRRTFDTLRYSAVQKSESLVNMVAFTDRSSALASTVVARFTGAYIANVKDACAIFMALNGANDRYATL